MQKRNRRISKDDLILMKPTASNFKPMKAPKLIIGTHDMSRWASQNVDRHQSRRCLVHLVSMRGTIFAVRKDTVGNASEHMQKRIQQS